MLPKKQRIERKYFSQILKTSRRFISPHFLLYIATQENKLPAKFSFSVSKKVSKKAVGRNLLRRRGYSVISRHIQDIRPGYFYFFSFKSKPQELSFVELEREIINLLKDSSMIA